MCSVYLSPITVSMTQDDDEVDIDKLASIIAVARLQGRKVMRSDILPLLGFPVFEIEVGGGSEITGSFTVRKK